MRSHSRRSRLCLRPALPLNACSRGAQFGEHSELALDAKTVGNEARFVNDYRNTGRRANVEFRLRRDAAGEMRQGVFICAKEGVGEGEELLISYGKSYWTARVGCMEEFITRRPGEAAPPRRI